MIAGQIASIFRKGSRTYFYSSVFFPSDVRRDVFSLYAFVRRADDFVDRIPQDATGFEAFVARYRDAASGAVTGDEVVDGYVDLARRHGFEPEWTESFFAAMRQDLTKRTYATLEEIEAYMYGSAEVIGLLMAKVMGLRSESYPTARLLGRAMQYVNFLRDVDEDAMLGRTYVPRDVLDRHGLTAPTRREASCRPERFAAMMRHEVSRYRLWQTSAEKGFRFLPLRYRIPIQTAADLYGWTADQIDRRPERVFEGKIKPSVARIAFQLLRNAARAMLRPQRLTNATSIDANRATTVRARLGLTRSNRLFR